MLAESVIISKFSNEKLKPRQLDHLTAGRLWTLAGSIPGRGNVRGWLLADHTVPNRPQPAWQKIAPINGVMQPVGTEIRKTHVQPQKQTMGEKKFYRKPSCHRTYLIVRSRGFT